MVPHGYKNVYLYGTSHIDWWPFYWCLQTDRGHWAAGNKPHTHTHTLANQNNSTKTLALIVDHKCINTFPLFNDFRERAGLGN